MLEVVVAAHRIGALQRIPAVAECCFVEDVCEVACTVSTSQGLLCGFLAAAAALCQQHRKELHAACAAST